MSNTFRESLARPGITFEVDRVIPATSPLETAELADFLSRRMVRKVLVVPHERVRVIDDDFASDSAETVDAARDWWRKSGKGLNHFRRVGVSRLNPLVDAIHNAFAQHRPLVLSPDIIWITIAQGFSHHVTANAETLRSRLVRHEGREKLEATIKSLSAGEFEGAIGDFSRQIREATDPVLHETLVCDFSTTTPMERTASEIVLMDTYSAYFEYAVMCVCGIPRITLEGTPEDWQRIRARIEVLATHDMEWWVSRLRPICDEFAATAEGYPSDEFWKGIYKPVQAYATQGATGWVTDLFPYMGDVPPRKRNGTLDIPRNGWALPTAENVRTAWLPEGSVAMSAFPSGLSNAAIKLSFPPELSLPPQDVDFVAGLLGVSQDEVTLALKPLIGWCVAEKPPQEPVLLFSQSGEPVPESRRKAARLGI